MRFVNQYLYPLFAVLLLSTMLLCWLALPAPQQPKTLRPAPEPWQLPASHSSATGPTLDAPTAQKLWGMADAAASAAPPPPQWRIVGIARNGAERFVLLAFEGKPVSQLTVGDALPDGLKIAKIEDDRFFVVTADKKKIVFGLYKNDPTK